MPLTKTDVDDMIETIVIKWQRMAAGIYRSHPSSTIRNLKIERSESGLWDLTEGSLWIGDAATYAEAKKNAEFYILGNLS